MIGLDEDVTRRFPQILYNIVNAFKFPDNAQVYITCNVEVIWNLRSTVKVVFTHPARHCATSIWDDYFCSHAHTRLLSYSYSKPQTANMEVLLNNRVFSWPSDVRMTSSCECFAFWNLSRQQSKPKWCLLSSWSLSQGVEWSPLKILKSSIEKLPSLFLRIKQLDISHL